MLARTWLPPLLCASLLACDAGRPDPAWVTFFDPDAAFPGYNLVLHRRRVPVLIDMNGNEVHRWTARASGRSRLLPDGHLLIIADNGAFEEYAWDGELLLSHRLPGENFLHHDLIALANGNRLLLAHDVAERLDYLLEVSPAGEVVWEWRALEHLEHDLEPRRSELRRAGQLVNQTHVNSIHELSANRWFDAGDARFRPGNLLLSVRNLNLLVVLDRATGAVVWRHDQGLDHQHEVTMIPAGYPGAGNIAVFNNGLDDRYVFRRSAVLEIDPSTGTVVWSYRAPNFYSSTAGTQQPLPNGNVLITSSRGGRIFEVTREGRIAWQWAPPYLPMRESRYPYDYCPQLRRLPRPRARRVESDVRTWVDRDLYEFALRHQTQTTRVGGEEVRRLDRANECRPLLLPEGAKMTVGFGLEPAAGAAPDVVVAAAIRLTASDDSAPRTLFAREVPLGGSGAAAGIDEETLDLAPYGLQIVELCFAATRSDGGSTEGAFFWTPPVIRGDRPSSDAGEAADDPASRALREKHLRALGYVD